jgi:hypothetical protein
MDSRALIAKRPASPRIDLPHTHLLTARFGKENPKKYGSAFVLERASAEFDIMNVRSLNGRNWIPGGVKPSLLAG